MTLAITDFEPCPTCKARTPTYREHVSAASILRAALLFAVLPAACASGLNEVAPDTDGNVSIWSQGAAACALGFFAWLAYTKIEREGSASAPRICGTCGCSKGVGG